MLLLLVILYLSSRIFITDSCTVPAVINGSVGYYVRVRQHQTFYQFVEFQVGKTFEEGESVFLLCNEGFIPQGSLGGGIGPPEAVFCGNGTWSKPMFCKPVSCLGNAPPIDNGYPVVNNRSHGHVLSYVCNEHYFKVDHGTVECHYGTWKGLVPACLDGRCYTRELNYPGLAKTQGEYANHLGYIGVACTKGYTMYQNGTKIQCNKGVWYVPQKLCVKDGSERFDPPIDIETPKNNCMCTVYHQDSNLQAVVNGYKQHDFEILWKMGDTAHLSCADSSMNLVWSNGTYASPSLTCDECRRLKVNDIPSCQTRHRDPEIRCSRFPGEDTDLLSVDYEDEDVRVGSRATFSCRNGDQTLIGTSTTVCLRSGEWTSTPPQCIKPQVQCPPIDENGSFAVIYSSNRGVSSTATLYCRDARHLIGGTRIRTCLPTGEWSDANPTCRDPIIRCTRFPAENTALVNVHYEDSDVIAGSTATFSCRKNEHKLNGTKVSVCLKSGVWSSQPPHCSKPQVQCPPIDENGTFAVCYSSNRGVSSTATLHCRDASHLVGGTRIRTCLPTGEWSDANPTCRAVTCEEPLPPVHSSVLLPDGPKVGMKALYSCDDGRTLVGSSVSECLITGEWTSPQPECLKKCSSEPPEIPNGRFNNTSRDHNSEVKYECEPGYKISGRPTVRCLDGEWSGQPPDCVKEKCSSEPPEIPNGRFHYTSPNSEVEYVCEPGYNMSPSSSVKCLNGEWSGQPPVCVEISEKCSSDPPEIPNGGFRYTNHNSEVEYECDTGYTIGRRSTVKCLDGEWSGQPAVCVEEKCSSDPPEIPNGRFHYTRRDPIPEIEYDCYRGYKMAGDSTVKCLSGEWRGQPPVCEEVASECICNVDRSTPGYADKVGYSYYVQKGEGLGIDCTPYGYKRLLFPNGMRASSAVMICDGCQPWRPSAVPSCVDGHEGDAVIAWNSNHKFQHTGVLEPLRGEKLEIGCFSGLKEYPHWDYSHTKEQFQVINNITRNIYVSYLIIPEFNPKYVGIYECSTSKKNRRPTKFELRLKGT